MGAGLALAGPDEDSLTINGEIAIVTETAAPAHVENLSTIYSGWRFRSNETQAVQMDDFDNPGMIGVEKAMANWETVEGTAGESCAGCHGGPAEMAGVRAVYPKWNEEKGMVTTLEMEVNNCRETRMGAEKWKYTSG
ncbi:MAG: sulfur oxidation c-type cytochrome SoxA, partial [Pseudomonadota bacterium]